MSLPLFGPIGTMSKKHRTSRWYAIHDDLRLQFRRDSITRFKPKRIRHLEKSNRIKQQGA